MKKSNVISDRASFKRAAIMFPQTASQPAIRLLFLIFSSNKYPDQSSSNQSQIHLLFINNLLIFMDNIYYIASEYNWFKFIPEKSYIFLNIHILCGHDGVFVVSMILKTSKFELSWMQVDHFILWQFHCHSNDTRYRNFSCPSTHFCGDAFFWYRPDIWQWTGPRPKVPL